jgi:hypothetical protein
MRSEAAKWLPSHDPIGALWRVCASPKARALVVVVCPSVRLLGCKLLVDLSHTTSAHSDTYNACFRTEREHVRQYQFEWYGTVPWMEIQKLTLGSKQQQDGALGILLVRFFLSPTVSSSPLRKTW